MTLDMAPTIVPKSDQLNADDLIGHAITATIISVTKGNAEQPVHINLEGFDGRPYKPSKSMRRVLVAAWGTDASKYAGRRLTLFRNPEIMFGKDKVGGIQISHLSHIDKPITLALTVSRGKKAPFTVQPLVEPKKAPAPRVDWTAFKAATETAGFAGEQELVLALASDVLNRELTTMRGLTQDEVDQITAAMLASAEDVEISVPADDEAGDVETDASDDPWADDADVQAGAR